MTARGLLLGPSRSPPGALYEPRRAPKGPQEDPRRAPRGPQKGPREEVLPPEIPRTGPKIPDSILGGNNLRARCVPGARRVPWKPFRPRETTKTAEDRARDIKNELQHRPETLNAIKRGMKLQDVPRKADAPMTSQEDRKGVPKWPLMVPTRPRRPLDCTTNPMNARKVPRGPSYRFV